MYDLKIRLMIKMEIEIKGLFSEL